MRSARSITLAIGLALAAGPIASAQSGPDATAKLPQFEVVSLKPSDPNAMHMIGVKLTGDRLAMNFETLKGLICIAYNIPNWELSGGEPWMGRNFMEPQDHYDFQATLPQDLAPYNMRHGNNDIEDEHVRQMMQSMLADRFHLRFHRETTTGTISLLEQSGKPLLLTASTERYAKMYGSGYTEVGGAVEGKGVSMYNTSMPQLAQFLSGALLHHPVIDKTGLDGNYDFRSAVIVTKEDFQNNTVMDMWLPAVKEMGLKLTAAQGPVETFVIDHAERPSPN